MIDVREIERSRIVAVLTAHDPDEALAVARAAEAGGLRCLEVVLRTPVAVDCLHVIAEDTDLLVGAGTVVSAGQVYRAAAAGARFVISPGWDPDVVAHARSQDVLAIPGIATATELQAAQRHRVGVVKFFPADRLGGLGTIRALAAPFPDARFIPSGGVSDATIEDYLHDPAILAVSGSWVFPADAVARGDMDAVTKATRRAVSLAEGVRRR